MELIKENKEKFRSVWKLPNGNIRKYWYNKQPGWIEEHVDLLRNIVPNYVVDHGHDQSSVWLDMFSVKGISANTIPHTEDFIKKIYQFCLDNIKATSPYAHGDWVLSNIIIDGETMSMCDWDNLNIYSKDEVIKKLKNDLRSAFGEKFIRVINDSASI